MPITTTNPFDEEIINHYDQISLDEVLEKIKKAKTTFESYKKFNYENRAVLLKNTATLLRNKKNELAKLMALEMGKPIKQGIAECEKCAWVCEYYAENGQKFLEDKIVKTEMQKSFVSHLPLGVIFSIMPWNFPFWQVFRFAAPNMMAGNVVVLKHSPNTMGCAFEIEKIFREAGFPDGSFTNLCIDVNLVEYIIQQTEIAGVTFTGSTRIGKLIGEYAGKNLKKCVIELGGSDPYIILEDADLDKATDACVIARMINNGQSCIAGKRFIIVENVFNDFAKLFVEKMSKYQMGNPLDEQTTLGPIARKDLQLNLHTQVKDAIDKGADLLLGGTIPDKKGFFYPPTVLSNIQENMNCFYEEVFGPVALLIKVKNEREAITLANVTRFGLGSAVFTKDIERGERIARFELESGCSFVNDFVKSDPRLPFGGIKESGIGREIGEAGIKEFVNIKTICIK